MWLKKPVTTLYFTEVKKMRFSLICSSTLPKMKQNMCKFPQIKATMI